MIRHAGSLNFPFDSIGYDNPQAVIGLILGRDCHQSHRCKRRAQLRFLAWLIIKGLKPNPVSNLEIEDRKLVKLGLYFCIRFHPMRTRELSASLVVRGDRCLNTLAALVGRTLGQLCLELSRFLLTLHLLRGELGQRDGRTDLALRDVAILEYRQTE